jgi:hypothetical protein
MDPREETIPALVLGAAERFGARHAIEDAGTTLTFADLAEAGLCAAEVTTPSPLDLFP